MADNDILSEFIKVVETGRISHFEHHYQHDGINAWLEIVAARIDNGLAVTISNISEKTCRGKNHKCL